MKEKNKHLIIGVAGNAQSGKDTFSDLLIRELNHQYNICSQKTPFADALKKESEQFLLKTCGLDIWKNEDKIKAREFLVWLGIFKRKQSNGTYWVNKVKKRIEANTNQYNLFHKDHKDIFIISDCRFKEYDYDELDYIKENGILVFIDKFENIPDGEPTIVGSRRKYTQPANEHESKNNLILRKEADYKIEWLDCKGTTEEINKICLGEVQKFIVWAQQWGSLKLNG